MAESHSRPGHIALNLHYHWRDRVCMATKVVLPISVGMAVCLRCFSIHSLSHSSPLYLPCLVYSGSLSGGATIVLLTVRRSPLTLSLSFFISLTTCRLIPLSGHPCLRRCLALSFVYHTAQIIQITAVGVLQNLGKPWQPLYNTHRWLLFNSPRRQFCQYQRQHFNELG